jgi:hypothetical protein
MQDNKHLRNMTAAVHTRFTRSLFVGLIHLHVFIRVFANMYKMFKFFEDFLSLKLYIIHSSQLIVANVAIILFFSYELIPRLFLFCFDQYADESPAGYLTRGILYSLRKEEANASQKVSKTIRIGL